MESQRLVSKLQSAEVILQRVRSLEEGTFLNSWASDELEGVDGLNEDELRELEDISIEVDRESMGL